MTWMAVLLAFLAAAVLGALMPRAIALLPEPVPVDPAEQDQYYGPRKEAAAPPKPLYRDLATRPRVTVWLALASGVCAALMALGTGWDWRLLALVVVAAPGAALAYVDAHTRLLPVRLVYPAVGAGALAVALAAALSQDWDIALRGLIGGAGSFLVFHVLCVVFPRGMGYGDVRLAGLLGMVLGQVGYAELGVGMYGAFLLGGIGGLLLSLVKVVSRKRMPFGPWMLASAVLAVPLGEPITSALLGV